MGNDLSTVNLRSASQDFDDMMVNASLVEDDAPRTWPNEPGQAAHPVTRGGVRNPRILAQ